MTMKNKVLGVILIVIVVAISGSLICYHAPMEFVRLNADDVLEIVILNGNTGETLHVSDQANLEHILSNWAEVTLRRNKILRDYTGFSFRITIYLNDGEEADGWNNFIISSNDTIKKGSFSYKITDTFIDYKYIEALFTENIE